MSDDLERMSAFPFNAQPGNTTAERLVQDFAARRILRATDMTRKEKTMAHEIKVCVTGGFLVSLFTEGGIVALKCSQGIPKGAELLAVYPRYEKGGIAFVFRHESLPDVARDEPTPEIIAGFVRLPIEGGGVDGDYSLSSSPELA